MGFTVLMVICIAENRNIAVDSSDYTSFMSNFFCLFYLSNEHKISNSFDFHATSVFMYVLVILSDI